MTKTLDEWLRDAHLDPEAGCPPPEAYLPAKAGGLSPEERRALDEHAARCPACAAERDLAGLFDAAPEGAQVRSEDLSFVVSRLEEASPVRPAKPKVVPFPGPRREAAPPVPAWSRSFLRFAAAAVLVVAAGLGYRAFQAPDLPPPEVGEVVRGGEVEAVFPVGEMAEIPGELRWVPREGAASYRVRLTAVDGAVLWEGTALAPPLHVPAEIAGRLHRAVVYTWTVEALGPAGERLASSGPVTFKAKP
jgi:hypothetical protein